MTITFKKKSKRSSFDETATFTTLTIFVDNYEVGFLMYSRADPNLEFPPYSDVMIEEIKIRPEEQGKGYGYLLMKKTLSDLDKKHLSIELAATFDNENRSALIRFYKQFGFREATVKDYRYFESIGVRLNRTPSTQLALFRDKQ